MIDTTTTTRLSRSVEIGRHLKTLVEYGNGIYIYRHMNILQIQMYRSNSTDQDMIEDFERMKTSKKSLGRI